MNFDNIGNNSAYEMRNKEQETHNYGKRVEQTAINVETSHLPF